MITLTGGVGSTRGESFSSGFGDWGRHRRSCTGRNRAGSAYCPETLPPASAGAEPAGGPRAGADPHEQLAGHDDALDLVGALVDLGDLGVAHHPLEREVRRVAGAAEQLDRIGRDPHRHVGGVALGGRAEEGEVLVAALGLGGRDVDHLPRGLELHGHVGEHELDALEVGDPLAELLALLDVRDGLVERALRDADGLGADGDPGVVERAQGDLQPVARLRRRRGRRGCGTLSKCSSRVGLPLMPSLRSFSRR